MSRRVFDKLTSAGGLVAVVVLLAAGGLMTWGSSFANSSVHNQLAMQQIYFPSRAAFAHPKAGTEITPSMIPTVSQYAGQQLLTGPQAEAYANNFIAVHLSNMPYHGVYANVSAAAMAAAAKNPTGAQATQLKALQTTVFQGTTLRGLLLEAYAFWTIGQVMFWGAIASFAGALILSVLVGLGLAHAARTPVEKPLFASRSATAS